MKKTLTIRVLVALTLIYLLGSFVYTSFNIHDWDKAMKIIMSITWLIYTIINVVIFDAEIKDGRKHKERMKEMENENIRLKISYKQEKRLLRERELFEKEFTRGL